MTNPILSLSLEKITLTLTEHTQNLPINLTDIMAIFTTIPPSELAWEKAIYLVEESISPLRSQLTEITSLNVTGDISQNLRLLPLETDEITGQKFLSNDTLEMAFAVLAGYRSRRDLGLDLSSPLPEIAEFYAMILLLREWVHHLDFQRIYWQ